MYSDWGVIKLPIIEAVTFIPYTNKFYVGALGENGESFQGRQEQNYEPIAILHPKKLAMMNDGFGGRIPGPSYDRQGAIEYVNHEMMRKADRYVEQYGHHYNAEVDSVSLANITRVELMTEIRNAQYKDVYLINGVDKIPVPKLKLDYDIQLHIKTRGKNALVPKRQKPQVEAPEFIQANFDMVKFGKLSRQIDVADEDELSALISPTQKSIDDLAQVMGQDENSLILDELDTFVTKSKGSWSAFTDDHNTRNPLKDIATERARIVKNHGRPNTIIMNSILWADFVGNTFVKGHEQAFVQKQPGVFSFDKLPGFTFIIDEDVVDGTAYIYDRRAFTYGEGPMVSETFRDPQSAVSGNVIRKWVEPLIPTKLKTSFGAKMDTL